MAGDDLIVIPATLTAMDSAIAAEEAARIPRGHLGMSQIGNPDSRTLWLKFRWSLPDTPAPRTLRIFALGHAVEAEIARYLRMIPGVELHTDDGSGQFGFHHLGGHFAGSMDGAIHGIPEAPKTWHVWEAKSVAGKRFADLVKKGVKAWSPEYYAQLQCYMGASGMERAMFTAYNKDDSSLHIERVHQEPMFWEGMIAKAERIITDPEAPESTWPNREWYESKWMGDEAQAVYWGDKVPRPNCRNCRMAEAVITGEGARWHCHLDATDKDIPDQYAGCSDHQYLPCLLSGFAKAIESNGTVAMYQHKNGRMFANGSGDHGADFACYSSQELHDCNGPDCIADPFTDTAKLEFNARIVKTTDQPNF